MTNTALLPGQITSFRDGFNNGFDAGWSARSAPQSDEVAMAAREEAERRWIATYHKGEKTWPVIEQAAINHGFDAGINALCGKNSSTVDSGDAVGATNSIGSAARADGAEAGKFSRCDNHPSATATVTRHLCPACAIQVQRIPQERDEMKVLRYELVAEDDELPGPYVRQVTLDRVRQSDGSDKWAIRSGSSCLTKSGEWGYEPMPSSRTDEFIANTRFDTEQDAIESWNRRANG